MTRTLKSRKPARLLAPSFLILLAVLCFAATAHAGFGQITRFGTPGTAEGKISTLGCGPVKSTALEPCSTAFGVDGAEGNSVFVVDQPKHPHCDVMEGTGEEESCAPTAHTLTRYFRIQKFTNSGTGYKLAATAHYEQTINFKEGLPTESYALEEEEHPSVEGVAVDQEAKKLFVLITDPREVNKAAENDTAAGVLLAFKTTDLGNAGPGGTTPVLTGEETFSPLANGSERSKALLRPRGITVDPYKHEVILLAHVRKSATLEDELKYVSKEGKEPEDHYVLQRISESTGEFTERYEETGTVLTEKAPKDAQVEASSPVVAGTAAHPKLFVEWEGIVEVPYDFKGTPVQVYRHQEAYLTVNEPVTEGFGGGLLAASEGHIYEAAEILQGGVRGEVTAVGGPAIYERSGEEGTAGAALGFTGGQAPQFEASLKCVLGPENREEPVFIAAGSEGKVFALSTEFLNEAQASGSTTGAGAIVEFGPGGEGCISSGAKPIEASSNSATITEGEEVPPGGKVTFRFNLVNADQREVVWTVKQKLTSPCNGKLAGEEETTKYTTSPKPVGAHETPSNTREYIQPSLTTEFKCRGSVAVEAKALTDNLNTPEVTKANGLPLKFSLTVGYTIKASFHFEPTKEIRATETEVAFTSTSTVNPKDSIKQLIWNFGDGQELKLTPKEEKEKPVKHTYAAPCPECKVTLTVVDGEGAEKTSAPQTVVVGESKAEEAARIERELREKEEEKKRLEEKEAEERDLKLSLPSSIKASHSGSVPLSFSCTGKSKCKVTFSAATAGAVAVPHHHGKTVLKLGKGSITIAAGAHGTVTLHLSAQARSVVAKYGKMKVKVTWVATDQLGGQHRGSFTVTFHR